MKNILRVKNLRGKNPYHLWYLKNLLLAASPRAPLKAFQYATKLAGENVPLQFKMHPKGTFRSNTRENTLKIRLPGSPSRLMFHGVLQKNPSSLQLWKLASKYERKMMHLVNSSTPKFL